MIYLFSILLQAANGGSAWTMMFLPAMILVMYFFLMRPQMKKQKQEKQWSQNLKVGDRVITKGGIHGKVMVMNDGEGAVTIEVDRNTRLLVDKNFISMELSAALQKQIDSK